mmetsp:Transcript_12832/g.35455  ORF Transcript_12832/g.35455 Transcript_12832/m.35455 type:complete len:204 (-) Transcript_12832:439-1050(-)
MEQAVCRQISEKARDHREHVAVVAAIHRHQCDLQLWPFHFLKCRRAPLWAGRISDRQRRKSRVHLCDDGRDRQVGSSCAPVVGSHWDVPEHDDGRCVGPVDSSCGSTWRHFIDGVGTAHVRLFLHCLLCAWMGRGALGLPKRDFSHGREGKGPVHIDVHPVDREFRRRLHRPRTGEGAPGPRHVFLLRCLSCGGFAVHLVVCS